MKGKLLLSLLLIALFACKSNIPLDQSKTLKYNPESLKYQASILMAEQNFVGIDALLHPFDSLLYRDAELSYLQGVAKLELGDLPQANRLLLQATNHEVKESIPLDAYFYRGQAYYLSHKLDSAMYFYNFLNDTLAKLKDKKFQDVVAIEIARCNSFEQLKTDSILWDVHELNTINSQFSDHSPVVNGDESVLIFTSKRKGKRVNQTEEFYEDIFISTRNGNDWSEPKEISDSINTPDHEASIGLSADGQKLFIYKSEESGSIYYSELKGDVWTRPKKLGKNINSSYRETHASLSVDGKQLYFTSDRPGGFGGMDVYVSELMPDGTWGQAKNLGKAVNTPFDEEGPFIHPDNITLYFSSKGHNSIGGYDVFSATKNHLGTWFPAQNLGYPINNVSDNLFFQLTADGKRAYYASKEVDKKLDSNLFVGELPMAEEKPLTILVGYVKVPCGELPYANITLNELESGKIVGIFTPNNKTGKFILFLNRGKDYTISVEANDNEVLFDTISVSNDAGFQEIFRTIDLPPNQPCVEKIVEEEIVAVETEIKPVEQAKKLIFPGDSEQYDQAMEIENLIFPVGKSTLSGDIPVLNQLALYLSFNPKAIIEVGGHSDSQGGVRVNEKIAMLRANTTKDYLLRKGVNFRQIKLVSYGLDHPIAINQNKDGSWNEKGMALNRRVEFKVLRQGTKKLKILPIANIPEELKIQK